MQTRGATRAQQWSFLLGEAVAAVAPGAVLGLALGAAADILLARHLAVSTGAACSSGAIEPSHVLTAMGLRADRARASIRFSLGKQNSDQDIDFALALVPEAVARLRELSPAYKKMVVS